jgi:hypothetical protein
MAGWFPGVQRFVLISRLAVCSVGEDDYTTHCSISEQITPLQHATTLALSHGGVRQREREKANRRHGKHLTQYQQIRRAK